MLTIIAGIQNYACRKIENFEEFINNYHSFKHLGIPSEVEAMVHGNRKTREIEKVWRGDNCTPEIKNFLGQKLRNPTVLYEEKDEIKSKEFIIFRIICWTQNNQ